MITSKITGLKEIQRKMKNLSGKMERKIARSAMGKASTILAREVRTKATSATVKKAIIKRARNNASNHYYSTLIGVKSGVFRSSRIAHRKKSGKAYAPDEAVRYFRFLETGTKHMAAKPFLLPAVENKGDAAVEKLKHELGTQTENAVKS